MYLQTAMAQCERQTDLHEDYTSVRAAAAEDKGSSRHNITSVAKHTFSRTKGIWRRYNYQPSFNFILKSLVFLAFTMCSGFLRGPRQHPVGRAHTNTILP